MRHRLVDRLARGLHVLAKRLADVIERDRIPQLFATMRGPFRSTNSGAGTRPSGHRRTSTRRTRQRRRRPLAARSTTEEQCEPGAGHEAKRRGGQQVVLIAITLSRAVAAV